MIVLLTVVAVVLLLAYRNRIRRFFGGAVSTGTGKGTAFARVAEQEGKLIALRTTASVKKAEAHAIHGVLDEVDQIIG